MAGDVFAGMTDVELWNGLTDHDASVAYRLRCERELEQRGWTPRARDGSIAEVPWGARA